MFLFPFHFSLCISVPLLPFCVYFCFKHLGSSWGYTFLFLCYFSLFALAAFSTISFACFCSSLASLDGVFGIFFAQPLSLILFLSFSLSFASFLHLQNLSFWLPLDFCSVYLLLPCRFLIFTCSACLVMLYLLFFCFNFLACVSSVCFGQHFHLCLF